MRVIGIIPGRLAASRLPGKPLALIQGVPMIGHCWYRSKLCPELDEVYIATCDAEIADYAKSIGALCIMTSDHHQRASDRTAEALEKVEQQTKEKMDIVVMIQGDEPMIRPEMITDAVRPLMKDSSILVSNLMGRIRTREEQEDPSEIKVVVDRQSNALYFSREPIPSRSKYSGEIKAWKQICVIPFRRDFLIEYGKMEPTELEIVESIDMNRILENGLKVRMVSVEHDTYSVDTPEDLRVVNEEMKHDPILVKYSKK